MYSEACFISISAVLSKVVDVFQYITTRYISRRELVCLRVLKADLLLGFMEKMVPLDLLPSKGKGMITEKSMFPL